jgi:hypothetical protein
MKKIYTHFGLISVESNIISIINSIDTFEIHKINNDYNINSGKSINHCSGLYYNKNIIKTNRILLINQNKKIFIVDNKYMDYINFIKKINFTELLENAYLQNLIDDIYKDIKSNIFIKLLNYCDISSEIYNYSNYSTINLADYFDDGKLNKLFNGIEKLLINDLENIFFFFT